MRWLKKQKKHYWYLFPRLSKLLKENHRFHHQTFPYRQIRRYIPMAFTYKGFFENMGLNMTLIFGLWSLTTASFL